LKLNNVICFLPCKGSLIQYDLPLLATQQIFLSIMITGSKKELLDLVKKKGVISIDECARQTELAKTTLREHFLQLERDGYIKREFLRSGPGRPVLRFKLTRKGHKLFPANESDLMGDLIKFLKDRDKEDLIEEFFSSFWNKRYEKAEKLINEVPADHTEEQLHILTDLLEEDGFMPDVNYDEETGKYTIRECNCPFYDIIDETQLPCQLEEEFFNKLFKSGIKRTTFIAEGDFSCTYCKD
jgi:predicted ArsR family transcriptional regulator